MTSLFNLFSYGLVSGDRHTVPPKYHQTVHKMHNYHEIVKETLYHRHFEDVLFDLLIFR